MSISSIFFPEPSVRFFTRINVPILTAGEIKAYSEEDTLRVYRKFTPFMNFHLVNDSINPLEIMFDYNPKRSIRVLSGGTGDSKNQPFWSFTIKNDGTTSTTATEVFFQIETIR